MVTALIFAGGTGQRMNSRSKPKQFLEIHGKPIIIYTLEHFEHHINVDNIVIVCLESGISDLKGFLQRYAITKATSIIVGGKTGHESIYNGLLCMKDHYKDDDIVLIHDGVRPLITEELITENINCVKKYGTAITVEPAIESVVQSIDGDIIDSVPKRNQMYTAKAPQSFYFKEILDIYERAYSDGFLAIDSAHLLSVYGCKMHMVMSPKNNMKITSASDFYIFRALFEAVENQQIFGI